MLWFSKQNHFVSMVCYKLTITGRISLRQKITAHVYISAQNGRCTSRRNNSRSVSYHHRSGDFCLRWRRVHGGFAVRQWVLQWKCVPFLITAVLS